ncbi:MAG: RidA family protein [Polymorphobacter sp.]
MSARLAIAAAAAATLLVAAAPASFYPGSPGLPFSESVQAGDTLYLAGQIGAVPGQRAVVPGGIEAESKQAMDNIGAVLARRGLGYGDLVKCTVMLADMADWPAFNGVYAGYFKAGGFPARSAFGSNGLAYGAKVEVECIAYNPKAK